MRSLSDEEAWARDCIGEALPGCTVNQHDDGSEPGMYDLTITYPDGHLGAVEVTAAVDAQPLELWKLRRRQGKPWTEPALAGGWLVRVQPSARANNLVRQLPGLLGDLERDGLRAGARCRVIKHLPTRHALSPVSSVSSKPCKGRRNIRGASTSCRPNVR